MDIDREALLAQFFKEAEETFAALEEGLVAWESRPEEKEGLQDVFRSAHTLKGNASVVGLDEVAELAHAFESLLDDLRKAQVAVSGHIVTLLLESVDALREVVEDARGGGGALSTAHRSILARLTHIGVSQPASAPPVEEPLPPAEPHDETVALRARTLRVDVGRLDRMLDLLTEITVARQRLGGMIAAASGEQTALVDAFRADESLYHHLQEELLKLRLVPLGPVFRRYVRSVRDLALGHGKRARLEITGGDVEVDMSVVEHLTDPLTHMLRNAVDHGIEAPEVRQARGKDPCGVIELSARQRGGTILIDMKDDGAGLDRARIAASARARGIPVPETLTDHQIFQLVFEPGVSTAPAITDLSGRGIGMDVVRNRVEALRGSVSIHARERGGTKVALRLPLTVAIIRGFVVGVGDERYVIPLENVVECVALPPEEPGEAGHESGLLGLRGKPLPYLRLREVFSLGGHRPARGTIVVVEHEQRRAGFAVDSVLGETQSVIKPLSKVFDRLPGVSGSSILGTGRVAFILDVPGLLRAALERQGAANAATIQEMDA